MKFDPNKLPNCHLCSKPLSNDWSGELSYACFCNGIVLDNLDIYSTAFIFYDKNKLDYYCFTLLKDKAFYAYICNDLTVRTTHISFQIAPNGITQWQYNLPLVDWDLSTDLHQQLALVTTFA